MADTDNKDDVVEVKEKKDGSIVVAVPNDDAVGDKIERKAAVVDDGGDDDQPGDDDELREARRNRRRAKKDLIRKTNQEKDVRLQALQRENELMKRDIEQLKRNTKSEQLVRIDKGIEDAQVKLEYAKMKLAEATQNQDGEGMVEAQTLWQSAQEEVRQLASIRQQADRELRQPQQQAKVNMPPAKVQKQAAKWMERNNWYNPSATDPDSRVAKKVDELLATQGWDPSTKDYWEELDRRLQKELPHRYNDDNDDDIREVRRPRNVVGSAGREASAAYGGSNRTQFVLSPERVRAMKEAGAWENPERKAKMIKQFIEYDRTNRN